MKPILIFLLAICSITCKKTRGLETNREKKEFHESIKGQWKAYSYEYERSAPDFYIQENLIHDTIYRNEDGIQSKFSAEFKLNIGEMKKFIIYYQTGITKNMFDPINYNYGRNSNLQYDWSELQNGSYFLYFDSQLLQLRKYGDEIELYFESNLGGWFTITDRTFIKYVFKRI